MLNWFRKCIYKDKQFDRDDIFNPSASGNTDGRILSPDNPIQSKESDTLGRTDFARSTAQYVLQLNSEEGLVVGILGPWGSGKTSFINLMKEEFELHSAPILEFNPWMFSGAEQLVDRFFIELSAQLKVRKDFSEIALKMAEYGSSISKLNWIPYIGEWLGMFGKFVNFIKELLGKAKKGVFETRNRLENALKILNRSIIIIIDDIDRLSSQEIKDIFKLVRLTGCFPKIIYVLAFDRSRVEFALEETGLKGRDYLEKILQLAIDLPEYEPNILRREILNEIEASLNGINNYGLFDQSRWPDIFEEIVLPLFKNLRDVRRYGLALRSTIIHLKGEVSLVDVLALESVRIFLPDHFKLLYKSLSALTFVPHHSNENAAQKEALEKIVSTKDEKEPVLRSLINRIFPTGNRHIGGVSYSKYPEAQWLHERRVANVDILKLYFEGVAGPGLSSFFIAQTAFSYLSNEERFDAYLNSIEEGKLENVISSLELFEEKIKEEHVVPGVVVLLRILDKIPDRIRGMLEIDKEMIVQRMTYRLLKYLTDEIKLCNAVDIILLKLPFLSLKLIVINQIGHVEKVGHKLISKESSEKYEKAWFDELVNMDFLTLKKDPNLLRVFIYAKRFSKEQNIAFGIPNDPEITLKLLEGAVGYSRSQPFGTRAVRTETRLSWNSLIFVYDDIDALRIRIDDLKISEISKDEELLKLTDEYLNGNYSNE
ncbi:KAP family P-loop NTPase fold protein [Leptospira stimsonii]|uniref:NTPase KAP n=1 Tax=Leptospira stimsonii TaxID=2202203 RepID=A0ABY2N9D2_9LEPT|nr:P-loop NTPase fold protein [Leptospira stimsonii]TGK19033.1 NTPase KAP [Leptospira stimsonii]TGM18962.1 NTPase KAP [Leptospira stimsonii]